MVNQNIPEDWLSAYHDGELTDEQKIQVEAWLESSDNAREELGELDRLSKLLRDLPQEKAPVELSKGVLKSIEELSPAPNNHAVLADTKTETGKISFLKRMTYIAGPLASAAIILVVIFYSGGDSDNELFTFDEPKSESVVGENVRNFGDKSPTINKKSAEKMFGMVAGKKTADSVELSDSIKTHDLKLDAKLATKLNTVENDLAKVTNELRTADLYVNLNTTGKWTIDNNDETKLETTPKPVPAKAPSKIAARKGNPTAWEDVLENITTADDQVVTVEIFCTDPVEANGKLQQLLLVNSIPELKSQGINQLTIKQTDLNRKKTDENRLNYYASPSRDKNTEAKKLSKKSKAWNYSAGQPKDLDGKTANEGLIVKNESKTSSSDTKGGMKAKAFSKPNRKYSTFDIDSDGNGLPENITALYLEAEQVPLLNTFYVMENDKQVQKIRIRGRNDIQWNELTNNGTTLDALYIQNKDQLIQFNKKVDQLKSDDSNVTKIDYLKDRKLDRPSPKLGMGISKSTSNTNGKPTDKYSKETTGNSPAPAFSNPDGYGLKEKSKKATIPGNRKVAGFNAFRSVKTEPEEQKPGNRFSFQTQIDLPVTRRLGITNAGNTAAAGINIPAEKELPQVKKLEQNHKLQESELKEMKVLNAKKTADLNKRNKLNRWMATKTSPKNQAWGKTQQNYRVLILFREQNSKPKIVNEKTNPEKDPNLPKKPAVLMKKAKKSTSSASDKKE